MKRFWTALLLLGLGWVAVTARAAAWETLEGCTLTPNPYNDGDSFHVRHEGREFIFRLYFVDTPEGDAGFMERVREQAGYFGVSSDTVMQIGRESTAFVLGRLNQPFTVVTRWQGAQGRSKLPRFYAFVKVDGQDLGSMLVSQGLARVFGVRATLPDGTPAETVRAGLLALEDVARQERIGAWATARQLNVAEARAEALRSEVRVVNAPHTVITYTPEMPRRRLGEIPRDGLVRILEEYTDGWVRVGYEAKGRLEEGVCLRWDMGLPELPLAPNLQQSGPRQPDHL